MSLAFTWDGHRVESYRMVIKLYKQDDSPPCRAVMMLIEIQKIQKVQYIDIDVFKGDQMREEFIKMNPQHTVPTLVDGDFVIWDSHAIAGYLISEYGSDDSLYPKDPKERAITDQRQHFDSGILFPVLTNPVMPLLSNQENCFRKENVAKVNDAYDFLEKFSARAWVAGDKLTVADLCCGATVSCLDAILPIEAAKYPKVAAWMQKCAKLDYFVKTYPATKDFGTLVKSKLA